MAENAVVESSGTAKDELVRARAAPLKEIAETDGSGAEVDRSEIEVTSSIDIASICPFC